VKKENGQKSKKHIEAASLLLKALLEKTKLSSAI